MKILFYFLIIVTFVSGCTFNINRNWTKMDTTRQVSGTILHVVDWGTTLDIAKNPDKFYEKNFILGKHPSVQKVNWHFGTSLLLQTIVPPLLPSRFRKLYQIGWISLEGYWVNNNMSIGLNMNF